MSDQEMTDFGIWRDVEDDLDEEDIMEAGEAAKEAVKELRQEGIEIEHGISDVLEDEEGNADCVYCHYRAPDEEAVREHSERAGEKVPEYLGSISTDLDTETLRITTKALFAGASDLQQPAAVVETLGELIGCSDPIVQAGGGLERSVSWRRAILIRLPRWLTISVRFSIRMTKWSSTIRSKRWRPWSASVRTSSSRRLLPSEISSTIPRKRSSITPRGC